MDFAYIDHTLPEAALQPIVQHADHLLFEQPYYEDNLPLSSPIDILEDPDIEDPEGLALFYDELYADIVYHLDDMEKTFIEEGIIDVSP
jgi:hypothetical protein